MELNKSHRASFLVELLEAKELDNELTNSLEAYEKKPGLASQELIYTTEIKQFLVRERIKTIERVIVNNEMDY